MALFERCCASCHGPHGSLYGDKLTRAKDGSLSGVILNMMETQARLDPTAAMVDAMTAYHRAIRDRFLFLWVANSADARPGESRVLRGEAAPNARVELLKGDVPCARSEPGRSGSSRTRPSLRSVWSRGRTATKSASTIPIRPSVPAHGRSAIRVAAI